MSFDIWMAFVLASVFILVIPGPTIILVVTQAVTHGRWSVLPLVAGVLLGDLTSMTLSFMGLGALLSASAVMFSVFKWGGAVYLIYLGISMWRMNPKAPELPETPGTRSSRSLMGSSFVVTALNPKGIAFFAAFLPQFIDPGQPATPQLMMLGGTFLSLAAVNAVVYSVFAGELQGVMGRPSVKRWFNRCGGSALIGAGIVTASLKRSA
ncbi:MAG TPA: lysine transporter LysE [Desulfobacteraceae bacterium]|nr:lysine transporter LysE [Desulfobacteraceae bacterium]|tara:strand:+ start:1542 stop:2168 length:627 start_codon:yes stop_codon:yes gene_type:complete